MVFDTRTLPPRAAFKISRPLNLAGDLAAPGFLFRDMYATPGPLTVWRLQNVLAKFDGKGVALFDLDDLQPTPVSDNWGAITLQGGERESCAPDEELTVATIAFRGRRNHCHMLLEGLPRFALADLWPDLSPRRSWADGTISAQVADFAALLMPGVGLRFAPANGVAAFKDLIISDAPKHPAHWAHPTFVNFLKSAVERSETLHRETPKRVYIDRASTRSAQNREALLKLLAAYDFVPVRLEDTSAAEQMALFGRAEAVVGEHGAGLTNIVFSDRPERLLVVEIMPSRYATPAFWILASALRARYCVVPEVGGLQAESDPSTKRENILVDLACLEDVLCRHLKTSAL